MTFDLILKIINVIVLVAFGFIVYKYFPIVKNISNWMKDVSSVGKDTQDVLSRLYDPKEIENIVKTKVELFKNKHKEELLKTKDEYENALKEQKKALEEVIKENILSFLAGLNHITSYLDLTILNEVQTNLKGIIDESYHILIDLVFDTQRKMKISEFLMEIGQTAGKQ